MTNLYIDVAEILVDADTKQVGVRFGGSDVYVMPPRAADSLGRGLLDCAAALERRP